MHPALLNRSYLNTSMNSIGLAGYWRVGEASGTVATTAVGATVATYVGSPTLGVPGLLAGDPNTAITVDGSGSTYVSVADTAAVDFGDGPYTFAIWAKRAVLGASHSLMGKGSSAATLEFDPGTNKIRFYNLGVALSAISTVAVADTTTAHFIVGTRSGATWLIYLDGADVSASEGAGGTTSSNANALTWGLAAGAFNGVMDEPQAWSRDLVPQEIANLYRIGRGF